LLVTVKAMSVLLALGCASQRCRVSQHV